MQDYDNKIKNAYFSSPLEVPEYVTGEDTETAEEFSATPEEYDCDGCTDAETADEFDSEGSCDNCDYDPSDETAATIDEWYTASDRQKQSARERCKLDDYEIISDVLGSEKQLVKQYTTALCEAAEEPLRSLIKENINSAAQDQYKTFEYMSSRGLYNTEQASEQDINEVKSALGPIGCSCVCGCDNN